MTLSIAQADKRRDLMNEKRRLLGKVERYRRLRDEYHVMWAEAELELGAVTTELATYERMRRP
jgi:hypothetical protein